MIFKIFILIEILLDIKNISQWVSFMNMGYKRSVRVYEKYFENLITGFIDCNIMDPSNHEEFLSLNY